MQGDRKVLAELNKVLINELTAINQYFLHARMYKSWGFSQLNEHDYRASIQAMKIADTLIERILFLQGLPNLQQLGKLFIGENPQESLQCDMTLVTAHITALRFAISITETANDFISRDLLADSLQHKEAWLDWLTTQIELVQQITLPNYLQTQI
jgi:bacterioferritin